MLNALVCDSSLDARYSPRRISLSRSSRPHYASVNSSVLGPLLRITLLAWPRLLVSLARPRAGLVNPPSPLDSTAAQPSSVQRGTQAARTQRTPTAAPANIGHLVACASKFTYLSSPMNVR
ncbi:hypothetical protein NUW54_g11861 [Trametes sanguinea]|uniref:Uncharacterized protein n=1 Tax=Trametes sanguinea TaxID=158606 RepID=A0ACC1N879_9APHY|nr:hypothetical protein NUW54_g11861 [Trametes sanguinea]